MGVLKHEALQEVEKPLIASREANVFSVLFTVPFFPRQNEETSRWQQAAGSAA